MRRSVWIGVAVVLLILAILLLMENRALAPEGSGVSGDERADEAADKPATYQELTAFAQAEGRPVFVDVWASY